jgi:hypothetical protein
MLAAKAMLDWTGDARWADAWRESAKELWRRRYWDGVWTYPPYGKSPGASHGIGTNTNVLLQGGELFPGERREQLRRDTAAALAKIAVREHGLANWATSVEDCDELDWEGGIRMQWCHGGAGVVALTRRGAAARRCRSSTTFEDRCCEGPAETAGPSSFEQ